MSSNATTCSNCGTENPPGRDHCVKCDQPLSASADEGLRANLDAQDRGGLLGTSGGTVQGGGLDAGVMGGAAGLLPGLDVDRGLSGLGSPDYPGPSEGLPPRRS